ncbi:Zinc finger (ISS) [Trypanosoma rangeli]|uniref:RING-type E3 ubiquitin transferase n=1 Tax=Trypanosoma rangeli TaxID=5698 RepID=A0A422NLD1_TRYRA|nr:Zinc finger (ISS) [Trypanosoma rangeli]RNF06273.1 Zinc finger (ISS) [Trypanosoma rangeli]|eukprot:RNF06273.1 Zinc finger (ISS) [Trypanosoma rangeli]
MGDATSDNRYAFSRTQPISPPGYVASVTGGAPAHQNALVRGGHTVLHAATTPTTSTQGVSMPHQGSALMTNNPPTRSQFLAHREGFLTQLRGRYASAPTVAPPTANERSFPRWDSSFVNNNSNDSSHAVTVCVGSVEDAPPQGYFFTPISIGNPAENAPFASSFPYSTTPVLGRGPVESARAMGGRMPSSETSFQQRVKHSPSLSLPFDAMHGVARRSPGFAVPYSLNGLPQSQRGEKAGTQSNSVYPPFVSYGGTAAPSHYMDPNMHGFFLQSRQVPQTAWNVAAPALNVLHASLFSAERGSSAPQHDAGIPPPPPLPYPDQPEEQMRSYPRDTVGEPFMAAIDPSLQRVGQRHQNPAFWELFERLTYRPSSRRRRRGTAATGLQQRSEQSRVGGNPPAGGWVRPFRHFAQAAPSVIPSISSVRPRSGTPPPPPIMSWEMRNPRATLHFALTHRVPRLSESYLFEAAHSPDVDNMSYEELLDLAESIGRVERGVPRERLLELRVVLQPIHFGVTSPCRVTTERTEEALSPRQELQQSFSTREDECLTCCVCLDSFAVGHVATQLPCCHHFLHEGCASRWFESHFRCPICTRDVRDAEH